MKKIIRIIALCVFMLFPLAVLAEERYVVFDSRIVLVRGGEITYQICDSDDILCTRPAKNLKPVSISEGAFYYTVPTEQSIKILNVHINDCGDVTCPAQDYSINCFVPKNVEGSINNNAIILFPLLHNKNGHWETACIPTQFHPTLVENGTSATTGKRP